MVVPKLGKYTLLSFLPRGYGYQLPWLTAVLYTPNHITTSLRIVQNTEIVEGDSYKVLKSLEYEVLLLRTLYLCILQTVLCTAETIPSTAH